MKRILFVAAVTLWMVQLAMAVKPAAQASLLEMDRFTLSGYVKNATSINVDTADDMDQFMKIRSTIQLSTEYRLTDNIHLFTILREWYDSAYDAESTWRRRDGNRS